MMLIRPPALIMQLDSTIGEVMSSPAVTLTLEKTVLGNFCFPSTLQPTALQHIVNRETLPVRCVDVSLLLLLIV